MKCFKTLLCFTLLLSILSGCASNKAPNEDYKIILTSDMHILANELFEQCDDFENIILQGDGKMTPYVPQIMERFVEEVTAAQPNLVLITGDLTFNGEKLSHEQFETYLKQIRDAGIQVAVINGNHDVNNPFSFGYNNEGRYGVERIDEEGFRTIYANDGYHAAISKDDHSLSYVLDLNDHYRLMCLDTNQNIILQTGSFMKAETVEWVEAQLKDCQAAGKTMLVGMHHNLAIHHETLFEGYTLNNADEMLALFEKYNVPVTFSGHIHCQNIAQAGDIYDVVSGSLAVSTNQYGTITLNPGKIDYETSSIAFENNEEFFLTTQRNRYQARMETVEDEALRQQIIDYCARVNLYFFQGTLGEHIEELKQDPVYIMVTENSEDMAFLSGYVLSKINQDNGLSHTKLEITFGE